MTNYIYGSATVALMVGMMDMIDTHVPNGLYYYVDLMMPF